MFIRLPLLVIGLLTWISTTAANQRQVDVQIVPGTRYKSYALFDDDKFINCKASTETKGALLTFAFLQKGTFVIVLNDPYQQRAVADTLGWQSGRTYSSNVFVGKQGWKVDLEALEDTMFIFTPNSKFIESLSTANEMAVQIGNISMRGGYDIAGFKIIVSYLKSCFARFGSR